MITKSKRFIFLNIGIVIAVLALLWLGFLSYSGQLQDQSAGEAAPSNGRFLTINSENIYFQEIGPENGEVILFIHGTGSWSELWKPIMLELSALGYRCLAVDLPPFGFSFTPEARLAKYDRIADADRIQGLLQQLKINSFNLVGHSFGGRSTITTALKNSQAIKRLILINVALGFGPEADPSHPIEAPGWLSVILNSAFAIDTITAIATLPSLTKTLVEGFVADPASITPEIESMYQRPLSVEHKSAAIGEWLKIFLLSTDFDLVQNPTQYAQLKAPVHIIWGNQDTITPPWQAEAVKVMFKNSNIKMIEKVGHIPMIENSKEFSKLMLEIFKK